MSEDDPDYELPPKRVAEMIEAGDAQLVDVRQQHEWDESRIPGALHLPLDELPARIGELGEERPIVFQCRSGLRSGMATDAFRASGREAYNLAGGIEAWADNGLPIEPADAPIAAPAPDNS